jgi:hypothetical protein
MAFLFRLETEDGKPADPHTSASGRYAKRKLSHSCPAPAWIAGFRLRQRFP